MQQLKHPRFPIMFVYLPVACEKIRRGNILFFYNSTTRQMQTSSVIKQVVQFNTVVLLRVAIWMKTLLNLRYLKLTLICKSLRNRGFIDFGGRCVLQKYIGGPSQYFTREFHLDDHVCLCFESLIPFPASFTSMLEEQEVQRNQMVLKPFCCSRVMGLSAC